MDAFVNDPAGTASKHAQLDQFSSEILLGVIEPVLGEGGIIIPDSAQEKPSEGLIVAVGSGARSDDGTVTPLDVKEGDRVLFGKWGGTEVKIDGEDLLIMKESDIMGIIS